MKNTKTLTWVLIIFALASFIGVTLLNDKDDEMYFIHKGVEVSVNDYKAIQEQFKDYGIVRICNFETGDCVAMLKLNEAIDGS